MGADVHDRHTLLVPKKKEGELVIVKAWNHPQTQRIVAIARVLNHSNDTLLLSIDDMNIEIHIEARGDVVAAELDRRLYVLLYEIHFTSIN